MNKSIKLIANYFLGPLVFVVLTYVLYQQIARQPDLSLRWAHIQTSWTQPLFWLAFALMFCNWGIESLKWKWLMTPLEKISFLHAYKAILAGCSISMLLPNRVGEYGGRILYVANENKIKAVSLTIVGSISQLIITVIMGGLGLLYMLNQPVHFDGFDSLSWIFTTPALVITMVVALCLLLVYFNATQLLARLFSIHWIEKHVNRFRPSEALSRKQLLRILFLSFLRYMIFILQYIVLLQVMEVFVPTVLCFWLLTVFYALMAIVPTIGFTELPIRATAVIILLGTYSHNLLGIQAATFAIWIINLVLPAIIGSFCIIAIKIVKE